MPGHAVTTSTANDPLSSVAMTSPYTEATGRRAGFNAARHTTRDRGTPRASAARTNPWPMVARIACDCRRSSAAVNGRAMAVAGTSAWRSTSATSRCSPLPTEAMPPMGSQPVRAATNTRNNDVSSGGSDRHTSDASSIAVVKIPRGRVPVMMPSGSPISVAMASAAAARRAVLAARSGIRSATGRS